MTRRRLSLALVPAVAAAALLAPTGAVAKNDPVCPARRGTLAKDGFGRVWHTKATLYGCTTVYGRRPRTQRLGPWKHGTKVAWDGARAAWSVPLVRDNVRSDRLYAASAEDGSRWLAGRRALPAAEARVQRVFAYDSTAGWVTRDGAVVFAVQDPQEDAPTAIGALPAAPVVAKNVALVGLWPDADAAALASTVRLDSADADGDECGGSADYRMTLVASGVRVGVQWWAGWSRPFCG